MPDWVSWLCLCFFGWGVPIGIFNLLDRKPQIIINETGIFDRSAYKDFINWDIIEHAYWNTSYKQTFVCLIIKDQFKHLIQIKSKLKEVSLAMGYSEININLGPIRNIDHQKLTALIVNLAKADPSARATLLSQSNNLPVKH
ncbi:hypothetical protein GSY63_06350 [Mucilaginibacter sp. R11]|uniref:Uncharacterized protein n=2 Tax=Mucilaginibacter agri TaxID=2695265 RepID=A0A965ZFC6_9SPHI|nr:hypothetical protein [Mucilaginibacter agri]